ncbi:MAG: [acyl-carrier-protein] S-malonyltransferase [Magnetococcales bacterium]|nr:[acyl-carrier-protein] S-malonyltransferase [Magnetococcales bacterium]PPR18390.1 MAG: Malonyl CoA-acyl carrier protein transacylase [Pseudomonadota bacterium]
MFQPEKTIFVSPGQGSQKVGMGVEFFEHVHTKELFEMADDALKFNLSKLMLEGDAEELSLTANTQPALLLTSYAAYAYLAKQTGKPLSEMASMVAGHSLGEYASLAIAGAFSLETGLKLVRTRGEAMQKAVPAGKGGMLAVIGLSIDDVNVVAEESGIFVANDNSDGQVVLSGEMAGVDKAVEIAKAKGAKRALKLPVSAPFHSPLMAPAADVMQEALAQAQIKDATVQVLCNVTASLETNAEILKANLIEQVTGSVRWRESMIVAADKGVEQVIEIGTGKVLTGLTKRCDARLSGVTLNTPKEIDAWLESLDKTAAA